MPRLKNGDRDPLGPVVFRKMSRARGQSSGQFVQFGDMLAAVGVAVDFLQEPDVGRRVFYEIIDAAPVFSRQVGRGKNHVAARKKHLPVVIKKIGFRAEACETEVPGAECDDRILNQFGQVFGGADRVEHGFWAGLPVVFPALKKKGAEVDEQKRDRQYNASIDQLKKIIAGYRERRQGGHVVAAKLRFENERNIDLSGKIASNFRYIPDGRIVGVIARADEPFFIRALGYRSKEVKIADYLSGFDSEAEFYDIGEIQLSKLSSDEECTITGNVACSDEKEAGKLQSSFEGSVRISANETPI